MKVTSKHYFVRLLCADCPPAPASATPKQKKEAEARLNGSLHGLFVLLRDLEPPAAVQADSSAPPAVPDLKLSKPSRPTNAWVAGFVDANGWLEELGPGRNPWHSWMCNNSRCQKPHSHHNPGWILKADHKYQAYLIRHPNPEFTLKLRDYLNARLRGEPEVLTMSGGFDFSDYPEKVAPQELSFTEEKLGTRGACVLAKIPEDPQRFIPKGHDNYDGWTLYAGMPNRQCAPVRAAVERLQHHLGALRYPVGDQFGPYVPTETARGEFDLKLSAAVGRFQHHLRVGRGFLLESPAATLRKLLAAEPPYAPLAQPANEGWDGSRLSWRYLVGKPLMKGDEARVWGEVEKEERDQRDGRLEPAAALPAAAELKASLEAALGVVDTLTASFIEYWIREGIRKAGKVLVEMTAHNAPEGPVKRAIWMREEAAVRLELWRRLVELMGGMHGIALSCAFRDIETGRLNAPTGMISQSIHKTGLAIDLAVVGTHGLPARRGGENEIVDFATPINSWPIYFECTRYTKKTREKYLQELKSCALRLKTKLKEAVKKRLEQRAQNLRHILSSKISEDAKIGTAFIWRLYDRSTCDPERGDLKKVKQGIKAEQRVLFERLARRFEVDNPRKEYNDAVYKWRRDWERILRPSFEIFESLNERQLAYTCYRQEIRPFIYLPRSARGGDNGPSIRPDAKLLVRHRVNAANDMPETHLPNARSWLNLTVVGNVCGLFRITSNTAGFRDPTFEGHHPMAPEVKVRLSGESGRTNALGTITGLLREFVQYDSLLQEIEKQENLEQRGIVKQESLLRGIEQQEIQRLRTLSAWIKRPQGGSEDKFVLLLRRPEDYDLELMARWAKLNKESAQLKLSLLKRDDFKLLKQIEKKGEFAEVLFLLEPMHEETSKLVGLKTLVGEIKTGAKWAELLREVKKQPELPGDKRKNTDFQVCLQPIFELNLDNLSPARLASPEQDFRLPGIFDKLPEVTTKNVQISLRAQDEFICPAPGIGRALEWWHYQTVALCGADRGNGPSALKKDEDPDQDFCDPHGIAAPAPHRGPTFGTLMGEIGYSKVVIGEQGIPPLETEAVKNGLYTPGYGYKAHSAGSNTTGEMAENGE